MDPHACHPSVNGMESRTDVFTESRPLLFAIAYRMLGSVADGKVSLIAGVTADATSKVKAGELVNFVAQQVGGKGGGRPDMAQAGGTQPENLAAALASVPAWVEGKL